MDKILKQAISLLNYGGLATITSVKMAHLQIQALISAQLEDQLFYLREAYTVYNQSFR